MTIFRGSGGGGNATSDAEVAALVAYQSAAANSAAEAAASADAADVSEANASSSASNASTSASNASTSASNASTSASNASTSATNAANSASEAAASAASIDPATLVKLTGDQTIAGVKTFSSTISGSINGNAGTATTAGNVTGTVAIANGGTGQTSASAARTALGSGATGDALFTAATAVSGRSTLGFTAPVIDRAYGEYTTNADLTTQIPADDTIPQNTEGTQIISVSLTPKSTTNRVRLRFQCEAANSGTNGIAAAIFSSASANALRGTLMSVPTANQFQPVVLEHEYSPGSTSSLTFSVRVGPTGASTVRLNGSPTARFFGGALAATLIVEEISA